MKTATITGLAVLGPGVTVAECGTASSDASVDPTGPTTLEVDRPTAPLDDACDVDGVGFHLHCTGQGDTTVLLIAGWGAGGRRKLVRRPTRAGRARPGLHLRQARHGHQRRTGNRPDPRNPSRRLRAPSSRSSINRGPTSSWATASVIRKPSVTFPAEYPGPVTGLGHAHSPGLAAAELTRLNQVWDEGVDTWAALSPRSTAVTVTDKGHNLQLEDPDVVIREVSTLLGPCTEGEKQPCTS
jgi:hypothetical protein